ncbi:Hypothetical protein Cul131001_0717 [Corynebacterium ulcerans]|nr:Hypothetical protein Cul131001_0717 [Corynebacterium ulcerans]
MCVSFYASQQTKIPHQFEQDFRAKNRGRFLVMKNSFNPSRSI